MSIDLLCRRRRRRATSTASSPPVTCARVITRMLAPTERQSSKFGLSGFSGGQGREEALGHELEQALELEVVAQDLGDGAAGLAAGLVARARDAVGTARRWLATGR